MNLLFINFYFLYNFTKDFDEISNDAITRLGISRKNKIWSDLTQLSKHFTKYYTFK